MKKFQTQGQSYESDNLVSDIYMHTNRKLFEFIDDPSHPKGPFNIETRCLLVDSILNNLEVTYEYMSRTKTLKGLPNFLDGEYYDEAFPLHDTTSHKLFLKFLEDFRRHNSDISESALDYLEANFKWFPNENDPRAFLQDNWASFRSFCMFQPLGKIRDYFGEKNAIYFAFVGSFIAAIWIPAFVGVLFFVLGISLY